MTRLAERVGTFAPDSPQWRAARANGLGGSEIAAVLGLSPWCSPFTLWHRKAGSIGDEPETRAMSWGKRLEPVIAGKFAEDHPELTVRRSGTWRSKARPWQIANPDRLVGRPKDPAILEVKTAHAANGYEWGPTGSDQIPVYYRTQAIWYLDVLGYRECFLAVLIGGSDYREYTVGYDPAEAQLMRLAGRVFIESVQDGTRPPIDASESTYRTVRELHPDIDSGVEKEIPVELADRYGEACGAYAAAAAAKAEVTALVLDAMGSAQYATVNGWRIAQRVAIGGNPPHLRPVKNNERKATE
jgi:putative phage-type endonuclease